VKRRWLVRTGYAAAGSVAVAIATLLGTDACIQARADGRVFDALADVPPRTTAIVLGAAVHEGRPNHALLDRIDCAYELFAAGRVETLFASGGDGQDEIIARYLIDRGVPAAKIVRDPAGHRTRASMENAAAIGIEDAIICTQRYHQARAIAWARHEGIDAIGWVANRRPLSTRPRDTVRETLARSLAALELLVD
jgi:SanA protein